MNIKLEDFLCDFEGTEGFDAIKLSIASPDKIRAWSHGIIKKPETLNYRTLKPEKDGLFCCKIFGPIKDYECLCGKYKLIRHKNIVCERCGVEVISSRVRRERMGHIELAAPVTHIWFTKILPSRISDILDMPLKAVEKILYFTSYVIIEPGLTHFTKYQLVSEAEYIAAQDTYGEEAFVAGVGAEAVEIMLNEINLDVEFNKFKELISEENISQLKRRKMVKRLKVLDAFRKSGMSPSIMILRAIPVLPPELRPLVPLDGGRFATSDLNDLYRRVINRNNRLKRLIDLKAPEIIVRNEKRMLQESVDALFDNSRRSRPVVGANKRPLKSLADMLKGKKGRFRQNLLGKRVDYSGRSVIVVGPELKLHQCGLPKKMALELFRPFVAAKLEKLGLAVTLRSAKRMIEEERPEIWTVLESIVRDHVVLLNRAPTLHRLSIQGFYPTLIEGKAIQLHPLVCRAFNADFDGDQMAVHVPLSLEAQIESMVLMLASNNILNPASGKPVINPTQDIVLGVYYATMDPLESMKDNAKCYCSIRDVRTAYEFGVVKIHTPIKFRDSNRQTHITTVGRVLLYEIFPTGHQIPFGMCNKAFTSKEATILLATVYEYCGHENTVIFADNLMTFGFKYATKSGISFGKDDVIIPQTKKVIIDEYQEKVNTYYRHYEDGLITREECKNRVIDLWTKCSEILIEEMIKGIKHNNANEINSVYIMASSGARGSVEQTGQIAAMRGLMLKASGEIIEVPIISNFKEGLTVLEYFASTHGARKGMADTALKTANSGYLTRRLVDVAQDCIITSQDCGTSRGIYVKNVMKGNDIIASLSERLFGRTAAEDVFLSDNVQIVKNGDMLDKNTIDQIVTNGINRVKIRSVITCENQKGLCAKCYGIDLASGKYVSLGEAVGIIAAQSIGEPGTQLTMNTFHSGGVAGGVAEQNFISSNISGIVKIKNNNTITTKNGRTVLISRNAEINVYDSAGKIQLTNKILYGSTLFVKDGDKVEIGDKLVEWDGYNTPIITEISGTVNFIDMVEGVSYTEYIDDATGISSCVITDWKQHAQGVDLNPRVSVFSRDGKTVIFSLSPNATVNVKHEEEVVAGDIIVKLSKSSSKIRDITGGLPRVSELFEARKPKDCAIMSETDGIVEFCKDYKGKRRLAVIQENGSKTEYLIPKGKWVVVQDGEYVKRGDMLVDGVPYIQDILNVAGIDALVEYMIVEIQDVYMTQGVRIDDKHVEVILRPMLQKLEIVDAGDTVMLSGDYVDRSEFDRINAEVIAVGGRPAQFKQTIQSITKAALQTHSFVSAASFQETSKVLSEAAVMNKIDHLLGLKENVIVGRLIPSGTGYFSNKDSHKTK